MTARGRIESRDRHRVFRPELPDGTNIKLIGIGGVGGIVARYGAVFLASLKRDARLVLIDGDAFEPSNVTRMLFSNQGNKAAVVRDELLPHLAETRLEISAIEEFVTPENLGRLIHESDFVILAVDNHATRKLVGDHCSALRDVCLISAGNDGVGRDSSGRVQRGTAGNCHVHVRRAGRDLTPSISRFHPEIADPSDRIPTEQNCTEMIASVPQILFANVLTASTILNTLWLHLCGELHYGEICFDMADGLMRPIDLPVSLQAEEPASGSAR